MHPGFPGRCQVAPPEEVGADRRREYTSTTLPRKCEVGRVFGTNLALSFFLSFFLSSFLSGLSLRSGRERLRREHPPMEVVVKQLAIDYMSVSSSATSAVF
jgi:hypothetical protein